MNNARYVSFGSVGKSGLIDIANFPSSPASDFPKSAPSWISSRFRFARRSASAATRATFGVSRLPARRQTKKGESRSNTNQRQRSSHRIAASRTNEARARCLSRSTNQRNLPKCFVPVPHNKPNWPHCKYLCICTCRLARIQPFKMAMPQIG